MTISISTTTLSNFFQPNVTDPSLSLQTIKKAKGNINQIVNLLHENKETCLELFRKAIEERDSIAQIELSQAYCEMEWRENESKNSIPTQNKNFDPFFYYPREFGLFTKTYRAAMQCNPDYKLENQIAEETFRDAATQGYLPAFLELTHARWGNHTKSYGFATQLQPFVNQGNKVIDYHFGMALKHGSEPGTKLFYEGLYWIHKSDGIPVQFPQENEKFDDFSFRYRKKSIYSYDTHHNFVYAVEGSPILAPSREKWEAFIKEKVETAEIAPKESYLFPYNEKQLLTIVKNIGAVSSKTPRKQSVNETEPHINPVNSNGFKGLSTQQEIAKDKYVPIHCLSLYNGGENIGTISVQKTTSTSSKYPFEIYETITNQKIQPIIDLMENVMIRTGSPSSAAAWLGYLKDREYLSRPR